MIAVRLSQRRKPGSARGSSFRRMRNQGRAPTHQLTNSPTHRFLTPSLTRSMLEFSLHARARSRFCPRRVPTSCAFSGSFSPSPSLPWSLPSPEHRAFTPRDSAPSTPSIHRYRCRRASHELDAPRGSAGHAAERVRASRRDDDRVVGERAALESGKVTSDESVNRAYGGRASRPVAATSGGARVGRPGRRIAVEKPAFWENAPS